MSKSNFNFVSSFRKQRERENSFNSSLNQSILMRTMFNFQRVIISLILSLLLIITFCIPISFVKAFASPLIGMGRIYPLSLATEGNNKAGIKGYDYEYAYLKT